MINLIKPGKKKPTHSPIKFLPKPLAVTARVIGWVSVPLFPLFCAFIMDYMNYITLENLQSFWTNFTGSALFEAVVVLFLYAVFILVIPRIWIASTAFGAVSLICGYVNYMKVALNGDNFYPQDLAMLKGGAGEGLTSFISGDLPLCFWLGLACIIVWIIYMWFAELDLPRYYLARWGIAAAFLIAGTFCTNNDERVQFILSQYGMDEYDTALQSSNYSANGFVGAFTLNFLTRNLDVPDGYSESTVIDTLAPYEGVPMDSDAELYDVIVVLSESFFDPRILPNIEFSENPLPNYDRILANPNTQSGLIYTTALGGGTVRTEFAVLTGLTTDYLGNVTTPYWYIYDDVTGYVSNYKDAGYKAIAVHPYSKKFYSREAAYPYIGFDEFYGQDDIFGIVEHVDYARRRIADSTTATAIMNLTDESEDPVFLFAITMENHQPYGSYVDESEITVTSDYISESNITSLTDYVGGLADADRMLGTLANWIDMRDRPTVLLFFGDHLPTLGANHALYKECGFIDSSDDYDEEELLKLFSTPFVIYSNRELKDGLVKSGTDNEISDYNLLNSIAISTGFTQTSYMRLLSDFYDEIPYYNSRLEIEKTDQIEKFANAMELITYDRIVGKRWSVR